MKASQPSETDKEEYVSGENIEITVTLHYADKEILTTENGTYGGHVTIGEAHSTTGSSHLRTALQL